MKGNQIGDIILDAVAEHKHNIKNNSITIGLNETPGSYGFATGGWTRRIGEVASVEKVIDARIANETRPASISVSVYITH